ncbi:hypothetical protein OROMI_024204 [Orobanche minor]
MVLERLRFQRHVPQENFCSILRVENIDVLEDDSRLWCWEDCLGQLYAAICASTTIVFGSWGLLKGLKVTCYPSFMDQLSSTATIVKSRVQQDANAITSRGPGTTVEFSVALIEQLFERTKKIVLKGLYVLVPITNGSEEMKTISIIDVLRRAKVIVASVDDTKETIGLRKVKIVADVLLNKASKLSYDLIGGLHVAQQFASSETLVEMLKKQKSSKILIGLFVRPLLWFWNPVAYLSISRCQDLLRVRDEFTLAEIEHFIDPEVSPKIC